MSPTELFEAHSQKAEEIAEKLCYLYTVSGALAYREEAKSEARMALWKCCLRFDPRKQLMQRKKQKLKEEEQLWAAVLGYPPPEIPSEESYDPYKNFWIASLRRIRGSVLDLFRSERLIVKRGVKGELEAIDKRDLAEIKRRFRRGDPIDAICADFAISEEALEQLKPTMLYQEKFLSLDRRLGDFSSNGSSDHGGSDSFADLLPSRDRADGNDEALHLRHQIESAKSKANLSRQESRVMELCFHEAGWSKADAAKLLGISPMRVGFALQSALAKMRAVMING